MTNAEHENKIREIETKHEKRVSGLEAIISEQRAELREYRTALEGVKWLWKKIAESSDMQI